MLIVFPATMYCCGELGSVFSVTSFYNNKGKDALWCPQSLPFSRLKQPYPSGSPHRPDAPSPEHPGGFPSGALPFGKVSIVGRGEKLGAVGNTLFHDCEVKEIIISLDVLAMIQFMKPMMLFAFTAAGAQGSSLSIKSTMSFSAGLLLMQSVLSLFHCMDFFLPQAGFCVCPGRISHGSHQLIPPVLLEDSPAFECIDWSMQLGVDCKLDESACYLLQIIDTDVRTYASIDPVVLLLLLASRHREYKSIFFQ